MKEKHNNIRPYRGILLYIVCCTSVKRMRRRGDGYGWMENATTAAAVDATAAAAAAAATMLLFYMYVCKRKYGKSF